ncbi:MAG TPA: DUF58 domain-containing protein [Sphingobacteriaceae bacterium]
MSRFLDPKIIMAIKDLSLMAKTTVDGYLTGMNKSLLRGAGIEFSQYRSYQPGDDLRSLDWKMFARSDRYYVRDSEIETSISVRLMADASASMNHIDGGYSKFDYARYLLASLAYLANSQGDAIGLYLLQNELLSLAPRQSFQQLSRLFHRLETAEAGGQFTRPELYRNIFAGSQHRELLVFATDFYQQHDEIYQVLDWLSALRHEILIFHIIGKNELEMNYGGYTSFEDLESGAVIQADKAGLKAYRERLDQHLIAVRNACLNRNISYRLVSMDQPLDQALRDFLNQRNKLST